mmetsp:Transcript_22500/g.38842  ORF Transcript_22500/g.38842 Transcript_22500/m.38842 type:complete len:409 (+) Transcript_22500:105-1331(+)
MIPSVLPKLYYNPLCPYASRAWLAFEERSINYEHVKVGLKAFGEAKPQWYTDLCVKGNPTRGAKVASVPAIEFGGDLIMGSRNCVEYINEIPQPNGISLLPDDPWLRACVRILMEEIEKMYTEAGKLITSKDENLDDPLKRSLQLSVNDVNALIDKYRKPDYQYIFEQFSMADIYLVPFLDRYRFVLPKYRNFDIMSSGKHFKSLMDAYEKRPAFQRIAQGEKFYIDGYLSKQSRTVRKLSDAIASFVAVMEPEIMVAKTVRSPDQVQAIISEVKPKSWISMLTDEEAVGQELSFIESTVRKDESGVFFTRIPMKDAELSDKEKNQKLAQKLVDAIQNAPKPVVIQCSSGRRAGAAYAIYQAFFEAKRDYRALEITGDLHELQWPRHNGLRQFVQDFVVYANSVNECC